MLRKKFVFFSLLYVIIFPRIIAFHIDKIHPRFPSTGKTSFTNEALKQFFSPASPNLSYCSVATDPQALLAVAREALSVLERHLVTHQSIFNPVPFAAYVPLDGTIKTLQFLIDTINSDTKSGEPQRVLDPLFIQENFNFLKWRPDKLMGTAHQEKVALDDQLRLTYYVIYEAAGSYVQTAHQPHALYQLLDNSVKNLYTKQNILYGALEKEEHRRHVRPLCWVSRDALEQALLQGTIIITFPDGKKQVFGINAHNGIPFDKKLRKMWDQKRYWFFSKIGLHRYEERIAQRAGIVLAGDVHTIGFGKLFVLDALNPLTKNRELRLGLLVDSGAAFSNTMYKLDVFSGIFPSRSRVQEYVKTQPMFSHAYVAFRK